MLREASDTQNTLINIKQVEEAQSRRAMDYFGLGTRGR